jgi:hypothetical protein
MASRREPIAKTLARAAKEQGLDQERLRRWVSFLAICGVLERAVSENILENYYLKGGVAMELRFAEGARATKDLDIGMAGESAERLERFRAAVELGFDDFTFEVKNKPIKMERIDTVRLELSVRYLTRGWQTIDVDLGPAGTGEIDFVEPKIPGLSAMGLRTPTPVRCLNISEQVAQKLHACTGPYSKGRARDILDILLMDMLGQLDRRAIRAAAEQVFAQRATHAFPPVIDIDLAWGPELAAMAREFGYPITSSNEIESQFRAFVASLIEA